MAEADLLVQVNRGRDLRVRFQIEPMRSEAAGLVDSELEKLSTDTRSARLLRDGHLGQFEFTRNRRDERAATDGFTVPLRDEDRATAIENVLLRLADDRAIRRFEVPKILRDPVFVEAKEGNFIAGAKGTEEDRVSCACSMSGD